MWGWVGLYGRPGEGGYGPFIDEPTFSGDPQRATIKVHHPSTQPPSPLRNPRFGLRLMPIGVQGTLSPAPLLYEWISLFSTRLLEQISNHSRPASLMAGADTAPSITMEVLVEWDVITPVWIVLKGHIGTKDRSLALLITQKDAGKTA